MHLYLPSNHEGSFTYLSMTILTTHIPYRPTDDTFPLTKGSVKGKQEGLHERFGGKGKHRWGQKPVPNIFIHFAKLLVGVSKNLLERHLKPVRKQAPVEPVTKTTWPRNSRRFFDLFLGPSGKDQRSLFCKDITSFQRDGTTSG